jgi:hypothetical protein
MRLSDRTYDILKWMQKIFVLLAALYKGIAGVWNLPYGSEISETFLLLATFLLGILEIASAKYNKDMADVDVDDLEGAEENEVGLG